MSPFCGLFASFSLECGVAGAVQWGDGGAVPHGFFVWFAWDFPGCWGWEDGLCLALGFLVVAAQMGVISLVREQKAVVFSQWEECITIFFQNLMLLAVAIKLYCFKLSLILER